MRGSLERRISRIEGSVMVAAPTRVLAFRPLEDGEAEQLLANADELISDGRAGLMGSVLVLKRPRLTCEEWIENYGTPEARERSRIEGVQ
jgi:hypothetical protein